MIGRVAHARLGIALVGLVSGCSFLFTSGPPPRERRGHDFDCSTSYAAPIADGLVLAYQIFRTAYAASRNESDYRGLAITKEADVAAGVGLSMLFGVSSAVGLSRVNACHQAQQETMRFYPRSPYARPGPDPTPDPPRPRSSVADVAAQARAAAAAKAFGEAAQRASGKTERDAGAP